MHQPRAGQTRIATQLRSPSQHARTQNRPQNNHQRRLLRTDGGHEVSPNLHHQQADAQAEPQRGVLIEAKRAFSGW